MVDNKARFHAGPAFFLFTAGAALQCICLPEPAVQRDWELFWHAMLVHQEATCSEGPVTGELRHVNGGRRAGGRPASPSSALAFSSPSSGGAYAWYLNLCSNVNEARQPVHMRTPMS